MNREPAEGANGSAWVWTAKKELAALLLSQGKTWKAIEADHGIPHSTLGKWVKRDEFQARIDEHVDLIVSEARRVLRLNARDAAKKIVDLIVYGVPGHSTQLAAARDLLDRVGLKMPDKVEQHGDLSITVRYVDSDEG